MFQNRNTANVMLKKILSVAVASMLVFSFAGCDKKDASSGDDNSTASQSAQSENNVPKEFMRTAASEMTSEAWAAAKEISPEQLGFSEEDAAALYTEFAQAELSTPEKITVCSITENQVNSYMQLSGFSEDSLSDEVYDIMKKKLMRSVGNVINSKAGTSAIAAGSLLSGEKAYVAPDGFDESYLMIIKYSDSISAVVSLYDNGNGSVSANYIPVFSDEDTINILLTQYGFNEKKLEL